jgi:hypothetical protein
MALPGQRHDSEVNRYLGSARNEAEPQPTGRFGLEPLVTPAAASRLTSQSNNAPHRQSILITQYSKCHPIMPRGRPPISQQCARCRVRHFTIWHIHTAAQPPSAHPLRSLTVHTTPPSSSTLSRALCADPPLLSAADTNHQSAVLSSPSKQQSHTAAPAEELIS